MTYSLNPLENALLTKTAETAIGLFQKLPGIISAGTKETKGRTITPSHDDLGESIEKSKRIDLLITYSVVFQALASKISDAAGADKKIRILLLKPGSRHAKDRALSLGDTPAEFDEYVKRNIADITKIRTRLKNPSNIEFRLYSRPATVVLFCFDENVVAAPLLNNVHFNHGPALILNKKNKASKFFRDHFEDYWNYPTEALKMKALNF